MSWTPASLTPLEGGHSGETFLAEAGGERTVVRIYAERGARRGRLAVVTDAAVLRWVRGRLPVPEVLEVRQPDPALDTPAVLVTSFLPGLRGELLLPRLDAKGQATLGQAVARVLQRLGGIATPRKGALVGADLALEDLPPELQDLPSWARHLRRHFAHWSRTERSRLEALTERAQSLLDADARSCLVHSDFNLKNLLFDPETLEVTGLVDWEFAHSGSPFTDLGNLLRFERAPAFEDALLSHLDALDRALGLPPVQGRLERARAADLFALLELASRKDANAIAARAHALLRELVRTGDLHAAPP